MRRDELVERRRPAWQALERRVRQAERLRSTQSLAPTEMSELARLYRGMAGDLMRVRRDRMGADLEHYLDSLASRAHNALYAQTGVGGGFDLPSLILDFPGAVRRNASFFWLATALFYVPALLAGYAAYVEERYALAFLSQAQLDMFAQMYRDSVSEGRSLDANEAMTGLYVYNNIGIAFRCFATGIVFGVGTLFYLLYNGLHIGVVEGHLARLGLWENLAAFTASHSPWELTAIVISGAAGLQMGWSLVVTHGRTRLGNLQAHGLELLRQLSGATVLLAIAALLEAWYSPSSLSYTVKYATGGVGWLTVAGLLLFYGHQRPVPRDARGLAAATKDAAETGATESSAGRRRGRS